MRTNQSALVALNTDFSVPDRYLDGDVPLLPFRSGYRPRAVYGKGADRQQIALAGHHYRRDLLDEVGRSRGDQRRPQPGGAHGRGHRYFLQVREGSVHGFEVPLPGFGAALPVGLLDRLLDLVNRFLGWQHAGDSEIAGLHDRVDALSHAGRLRDADRIDGEEADLLLDHLLLHFTRKPFPNAP